METYYKWGWLRDNLYFKAVLHVFGLPAFLSLQDNYDFVVKFQKF